MIKPNKRNKPLPGTNDDRIASLAKKVKKIECSSREEVQLAGDLFDALFEEWQRSRNIYRKKRVRNNKMINHEMYFQHEAEQEIIVGLMCLLNHTMRCYRSSR